MEHLSIEIIERDILQARLLSSIFSKTIKDQVVLKGGMAMRAVHGSERLTKDIDLGQNPSESLPKLQSAMRSAIKDAASGFLTNLEVSEPKQTNTTARWKIRGNTMTGAPIHLTIEVSRRGVPANHVISSVYVPPPESRSGAVTVDVYDDGAMVISKIFALTSENRVAPRDLFDLDVLIKLKVVPAQDLLDAIKDKKALIEKVWLRLDAINFSQYKSEVEPFLPASSRSRMSESSFEEMRLRVGEKIEQWLDDKNGQSNDTNIPTHS